MQDRKDYQKWEGKGEFSGRWRVPLTHRSPHGVKREDFPFADKMFPLGVPLMGCNLESRSQVKVEEVAQPLVRGSEFACFTMTCCTYPYSPGILDLAYNKSTVTFSYERT